MIIIKKSYIYFIFITTMVLFILLGILSYRQFIQLDPSNPISLKYFAEQFLYLTMIALLVIIFTFWVTFAKGKQILNLLDKLIELSKQGKYSPEDYLKKLDVLGQKILEINTRLYSLNTMKTLKISSISNTINFLLAKIDRPLFISDISGQITKVSKRFMLDFEIEPKYIYGKFVDEIIEGLNFTLLVNDIKKVKNIPMKKMIRLGAAGESKECYIVFYPVFNSQNDLSNVIGAIESEEIYQERQKILDDKKSENAEPKADSKPVEKAAAPFSKLFSDLLHPTRKQH